MVISPTGATPSGGATPTKPSRPSGARPRAAGSAKPESTTLTAWWRAKSMTGAGMGASTNRWRPGWLYQQFHMKNLTHQRLSIERRDCRAGLFLRLHIHKTETAGLAGVSVQHHPGIRHGPVGAEQFDQLSIPDKGW